jgi:hypothetical protein
MHAHLGPTSALADMATCTTPQPSKAVGERPNGSETQRENTKKQTTTLPTRHRQQRPPTRFQLQVSTARQTPTPFLPCLLERTPQRGLPCCCDAVWGSASAFIHAPRIPRTRTWPSKLGSGRSLALPGLDGGLREAEHVGRAGGGCVCGGILDGGLLSPELRTEVS